MMLRPPAYRLNFNLLRLSALLVGLSLSPQLQADSPIVVRADKMVSRTCKQALYTETSTTRSLVSNSIRNETTGNGEVTVASLESLLAPVGEHIVDPALQAVRVILNDGIRSPLYDQQFTEAFAYLKNAARLPKVYVAILDDQVKLKLKRASAIATYSQIQPHFFVDTPEFNSFISRGGMSSHQDYFNDFPLIVFFNRSLFERQAPASQIALAGHELLHVADVLRVNEQAAYGELPYFLKPSLTSNGTPSVSAPHFTLFLEIRAYASMIISMHLQGASDAEIQTQTGIWFDVLKEQLQQFPSGDDILDRHKILNETAQDFDYENLGDLNELYSRWINSLI